LYFKITITTIINYCILKPFVVRGKREYIVEQYLVNTKDISAGTYKAVVKAEDNQDPPLTGRGISSLIEIVGEEFDMPDDSIQIPEPQIINVSPTGEDDISNLLVTIRASLLSSTGAKINEDSIQIKVDGIDVTSKAKFNKISEAEYTLIYQTEQEYEEGLHKVTVTFTDSNNLEAEKSWTFNISTQQKDPDKFYFFGYGISKIIVYVIAGGLLLLILALIVPLILVKVWKEDEEAIEKDDTLTPPPSTDTVEKMINKEDNTFSKLESQPVQEEPKPQKEKAGGEIKRKLIEAEQKAKEAKTSSDETVPITTLENNSPPEPDEDLQKLYEKINQKRDSEDSKKEPIE